MSKSPATFHYGWDKLEKGVTPGIAIRYLSRHETRIKEGKMRFLLFRRGGTLI